MRTYHIKYRTVDQLLDDVKLDLEGLDGANKLSSHLAIKVAQNINKNLGLKINKTKQIILDVENGRAKLPDDFYLANFLFLFNEYKVVTGDKFGTTTIDLYDEGIHYHEAPDEDISSCGRCHECQEALLDCSKPCSKCSLDEITCRLDCKGDQYRVYQVRRNEVRTFTKFQKIKIVNNNWVSNRCFNLLSKCDNVAWIEDGWIYLNRDKGHIYLNYEGDMVDEEGNLLVIDHPILNEYYEYAIKKKVFENGVLNGRTVNQFQIQLIMEGHRAAKNNAISLVNTPDFEEMEKVWYHNRNAMYAKYYSQFSKSSLF